MITSDPLGGQKTQLLKPSWSNNTAATYISSVTHRHKTVGANSNHHQLPEEIKSSDRKSSQDVGDNEIYSGEPKDSAKKQLLGHEED